MSSYVDDMFGAYIECALWSGTTDEGEPLDDDYGIGDIDAGSLEELGKEVQAFYDEVREDLELGSVKAAQAGHDFCLTRNHHGAGVLGSRAR